MFIPCCFVGEGIGGCVILVEICRCCRAMVLPVVYKLEYFHIQIGCGRRGARKAGGCDAVPAVSPWAAVGITVNVAGGLGNG